MIGVYLQNYIKALWRLINKLITSNNVDIESLNINKIIEDYQPGYLYGDYP